MSRYVVLGQTGSSELLMVDTHSKTVQAIDPSSIDPSLMKVQEAGETAIRGVSVAVAVDSGQQAVGRFFFPGSN